ncbi:MAG: hydrogenase [Candidatus Omnitrophica bacterium]|nr:hydrogenase [Candidatus Omnitrophota bacterium]
MGVWPDTLLICVMFLDVLLLVSSRLGVLIRFFAAQSLVLSAVPVFLYPHMNVHTAVVSGGALLLKGILIPRLLFWAIRNASIRREARGLMGPAGIFLSSGVLMGLSFLLSSLLPLPVNALPEFLVPAAFFTLMSGLFLLINGTKAITQVVAYLVLENGIFLFAVVLLAEMPLIVEMGIFLDVFVAVFIMGIVINHIHGAFDHMDVSRLTLLKD